VSKALVGNLLAIAMALSVSGCEKQPAATDSAPAEVPAASAPDTQPHPSPAAAAAPVDLSGIEKAAGGRTIAEVFAEKDQLAGETVVVRGRVVKVNAGIMGKNWLHVRDGSGAEGTNDLTVTTAGVLPSVGDTVLVTGPVSVNRDFGMGYAYPVVLEDAEVKIEETGTR